METPLTTTYLGTRRCQQFWLSRGLRAIADPWIGRLSYLGRLVTEMHVTLGLVETAGGPRYSTSKHHQFRVSLSRGRYHSHLLPILSRDPHVRVTPSWEIIIIHACISLPRLVSSEHISIYEGYPRHCLLLPRWCSAFSHGLSYDRYNPKPYTRSRWTPNNHELARLQTLLRSHVSAHITRPQKRTSPGWGTVT